jgi:hypothetical protein
MSEPDDSHHVNAEPAHSLDSMNGKLMHIIESDVSMLEDLRRARLMDLQSEVPSQVRRIDSENTKWLSLVPSSTTSIACICLQQSVLISVLVLRSHCSRFEVRHNLAEHAELCSN